LLVGSAMSREQCTARFVVLAASRRPVRGSSGRGVKRRTRTGKLRLYVGRRPATALPRGGCRFGGPHATQPVVAGEQASSKISSRSPSQWMDQFVGTRNGRDQPNHNHGGSLGRRRVRYDLGIRTFSTIFLPLCCRVLLLVV
jgi:hypothetical protein